MNAADTNGKMHDNPDPEKSDCQEELEDVVEDLSVSEEYADLDEALDQIGSYLDDLEEKNDSIYARLQDLLESNKQTRQEMEAARLEAEKSAQDKTTANDTSEESASKH